MKDPWNNGENYDPYEMDEGFWKERPGLFQDKREMFHTVLVWCIITFIIGGFLFSIVCAI